MKTLVVRLDSAGDVVLAGPMVRAAAAGSDEVTLLCGPQGAAAADLLPGVDDVIVWSPRGPASTRRGPIPASWRAWSATSRRAGSTRR
ncbi:MAG: hypothetical protein HOV87_35620 [Catenulispora sp.]|nr:hypothetical protein [Catenulispora sp.]